MTTSPNSGSITSHCFTVTDNGHGLRLDQALSAHCPGISREQAKRYIAVGGVWINGRRCQIISRRVCTGDHITLHIGREGPKKFYEITPRNILFEDRWLIFYRKEPGIPTQGLLCDDYNNVFSALKRYRKKGSDSAYVGMHHRLDIDTSGIVLFTLSEKINRSIHYQFKTGRVKKSYCALVEGNPAFSERTLLSFIGREKGTYVCSADGPGKKAAARFIKLQDFDGYACLRAEPETGRTHQIRLQLSFLGHPVMGDLRYGAPRRDNVQRTMLHAETLRLYHPVEKKEICIQADLFPDMKSLIDTRR